MTFSPQSNQVRAKKITDPDIAYLVGKRHGHQEALNRAILLLTYLQKTSGTNRAGVTEALEIVKGITYVQEPDLS